MPKRGEKAAGVTVKSSLRTLELLEYCDSVRRPVTVSELAARLGYPQSSTSSLVQSMLNNGYLVVGDGGRGMLPSGRVSALGRWVEPAASRADLKALMEEVGRETGLTVMLGVPSDLCVRYVDVVPGRHAMRLDIPIGARLPLVASGMGHLLLAQMSDAEVEAVLVRTRQRVAEGGAAAVGTSELPDLWNADPSVPKARDLGRAIGEVRSRGHALSLGRVTFGAGIICVAVPTPPGEQPMGVGVGGLSAMIERDHGAILGLIRGHAARLGLPIGGPG